MPCGHGPGSLGGVDGWRQAAGRLDNDGRAIKVVEEADSRSAIAILSLHFLLCGASMDQMPKPCSL